ncbi:glycosyltransferase family 4 protein [Alcaligenes endophyticus]|uniref:Glycosyltransferase family 4 protein n=1 Tax=Alcaligenes endophyticus TaxID=1929088 RepID=A0ABT8EFN5_9BURK|nr:glycosyltransferase family 4 protein [Alcaligenes endophyticus]MCX5590211.1 glycosyltransferase family 4 protein [Alcaligenes endophyticus]MDN4120126.1 glycosyltransferase family 4 protein [Alcaligenes endophyticus]
MNIAIIVNSLERAGPVIVALNIANNLKKQKVNVTVFYLKEKKNIIETSNLKVVKLNYKNFLKLKNFDCIHSHSLAPDLVNMLQKLIIKKPNITTVHNNIYKSIFLEYSWMKARAIYFLWHLSWIFIDKKVCVSKTLLAEYIKKNKDRKTNWSYIYNSVPMSTSYQLTEADRTALTTIDNFKKLGYKIAGTCANITERKGIQYIIDVAPLLPNYIFIIVGDGVYKSRLKEMALSKKTKNIFFFERTNSPRAYMKKFDVYVMPSIDEAFGLAALEALLEGCNLICSNLPVFKDLFNENSLYFDFNIDKSLFNSLNSLTLNNDKKDTSYITVNFDEVEISKKYINEYKNECKYI